MRRVQNPEKPVRLPQKIHEKPTRTLAGVAQMRFFRVFWLPSSSFTPSRQKPVVDELVGYTAAGPRRNFTGLPLEDERVHIVFDEHLHPNLPVSTCQSDFVERVHFFV
jgi:hypothetical protein